MAKKYSPSVLNVYDEDGNRIRIPAVKGKSAYEYAVEGGYTGSEAEFIEKLAMDYDGEIDELSEKLDDETAASVKHFADIELSCGEDLILSDPAVTLGDGWTGDFANGFTHSGGTAPLEIAVETDTDDYVLVSFTLSAYQVSSLFVSFGESPQVDSYFGNYNVKLILRSDGGSLKFTPITGFAVTVSDIVVRRITPDGTYIETYNAESITDGSGDEKTGMWNVLLGGDHTAVNNVAATRTVAIGQYALERIQYGERNVGIGQYALRALVNGKKNIAIGADALYRSSDGSFNVAVGVGAIQGNGTGYERNVAVGTNSLYNLKESGSGNTAVGHCAGYRCGELNSFVGANAGYRVTGNQNVAVGAYALQGDSEYAGKYNTAIGYGAQNSDIEVDNATAIGANASCDKSNQVVIGNDDVEETKLKGDLILCGTDGIRRQIVFNSDGSCNWKNVDLKTGTLTVSDFTVGNITANGGVNTTVTNARMYTDVLALPTTGKVSVECTSAVQWMCYFFKGLGNANDTYVGKAGFSSDSVDDVLTATITDGTVEGATHFRFSLRDASDTSAVLTGREEEILSGITITITE